MRGAVRCVLFLCCGGVRRRVHLDRRRLGLGRRRELGRHRARSRRHRRHSLRLRRDGDRWRRRDGWCAWCDPGRRVACLPEHLKRRHDRRQHLRRGRHHRAGSVRHHARRRQHRPHGQDGVHQQQRDGHVAHGSRQPHARGRPQQGRQHQLPLVVHGQRPHQRRAAPVERRPPLQQGQRPHAEQHRPVRPERRHDFRAGLRELQPRQLHVQRRPQANGKRLVHHVQRHDVQRTGPVRRSDVFPRQHDDPLVYADPRRSRQQLVAFQRLRQWNGSLQRRERPRLQPLSWTRINKQRRNDHARSQRLRPDRPGGEARHVFLMGTYCHGRKLVLPEDHQRSSGDAHDDAHDDHGRAGCGRAVQVRRGCDAAPCGPGPLQDREHGLDLDGARGGDGGHGGVRLGRFVGGRR